MSPPPCVIRARWLLPWAGAEVVADGALLIAAGRILASAHGGAAGRLVADARGPVTQVDGLLAPGLVNAHAHLDLSALAGRVSAPLGHPRGRFVPWIGALLRERSAASRDTLRTAARAAADGLLAGGVTTVGDIDTLGVAPEALAGSPLRLVSFREALDGADPSRADAALADLDVALRTPLGGPGERRRGLSPHAPHTVSRALMRGLGARRGDRPVQVHWSETREELDWLERGAGPFAGLLGPSPGLSGLGALAAAGLLDGASLVHGNHPQPGEAALIAKAGASIVHCPGTHAFFGRDPFPWAEYRAAGVNLALGTDSLASNGALDLRAELAAARRALPDVDPCELLHAATRGGAAALGLGNDVGELGVGRRADLVEFSLPLGETAPPRRLKGQVADLLTGDDPLVTRVWLDGRLAVGDASD